MDADADAEDPDRLPDEICEIKYEIERLLRYREDDDRILVKWLRMPPSENSWERRGDLPFVLVAVLLRDFYAGESGQQAQAQAAAADGYSPPPLHPVPVTVPVGFPMGGPFPPYPRQLAAGNPVDMNWPHHNVRMNRLLMPGAGWPMTQPAGSQLVGANHAGGHAWQPPESADSTGSDTTPIVRAKDHTFVRAESPAASRSNPILKVEVDDFGSEMAAEEEEAAAQPANQPATPPLLRRPATPPLLSASDTSAAHGSRTPPNMPHSPVGAHHSPTLAYGGWRGSKGDRVRSTTPPVSTDSSDDMADQVAAEAIAPAPSDQTQLLLDVVLTHSESQSASTPSSPLRDRASKPIYSGLHMAVAAARAEDEARVLAAAKGSSSSDSHSHSDSDNDRWRTDGALLEGHGSAQDREAVISLSGKGGKKRGPDDLLRECPIPAYKVPRIGPQKAEASPRSQLPNQFDTVSPGPPVNTNKNMGWPAATLKLERLLPLCTSRGLLGSVPATPAERFAVLQRHGQWMPQVMELGTRERNNLIAWANLEKDKVDDLRKETKRHKQNLAQKRYRDRVRRTRKDLGLPGSAPRPYAESAAVYRNMVDSQHDSLGSEPEPEPEPANEPEPEPEYENAGATGGRAAAEGELSLTLSSLKEQAAAAALLASAAAAVSVETAGAVTVQTAAAVPVSPVRVENAAAVTVQTAAAVPVSPVRVENAMLSTVEIVSATPLPSGAAVAVGGAVSCSRT